MGTNQEERPGNKDNMRLSYCLDALKLGTRAYETVVLPVDGWFSTFLTL